MIVEKRSLEKMIELASEITETAKKAGADWSLSLVFDPEHSEALAGIVVCAEEMVPLIIGDQMEETRRGEYEH